MGSRARVSSRSARRGGRRRRRAADRPPAGRPACLPTMKPAHDGARRRAGHVEGVGERHPERRLDAVDGALTVGGPVCPPTVGVSSSDTLWNSSTRRRLSRWHASSALNTSTPRDRGAEALHHPTVVGVDLAPSRGVSRKASISRRLAAMARVSHAGAGSASKTGVDLDDLRAEVGQPLHRGLAHGPHLGVDRRVAEVGRPPHPAGRAELLQRAGPARVGHGQRAQVGGLRADDGVEGEGHVPDRAGHRAPGRQVGPVGRMRPTRGHAAQRRLDARQAAQRRRDADGPAAVRPGAQRHHAGGDRGGRAAARSARAAARGSTGCGWPRRARWWCRP